MQDKLTELLNKEVAVKHKERRQVFWSLSTTFYQEYGEEIKGSRDESEKSVSEDDTYDETKSVQHVQSQTEN